MAKKAEYHIFHNDSGELSVVLPEDDSFLYDPLIHNILGNERQFQMLHKADRRLFNYQNFTFRVGPFKRKSKKYVVPKVTYSDKRDWSRIGPFDPKRKPFEVDANGETVLREALDASTHLHSYLKVTVD